MKHLRLMDENEGDDPILSVVNLIDVFLVIIAALLLAVAQSPSNPFSAEQVTIIKNPGKANMEVIVKDGQAGSISDGRFEFKFVATRQSS